MHPVPLPSPGIELCRHQEGNAEEYNGEGSTSPYVVARNSEAHHRPGLLALIDGIASPLCASLSFKVTTATPGLTGCAYGLDPF
mmetsp:Transcript_134192/g.347558  ORF Transcript_134192/g.347558 Transcript_134192/m.347558 type:complete len:84 (+) Transcript_134192:662-913(+)